MTRVTVCELSGEPADVDAAWHGLQAHLGGAGTDLLILPELAFVPWLPGTPRVDPAAWEQAAAVQERWLDALPALGAAVVVTSRPVVEGTRRFNEAVVWDAEHGVRAVHRKTFLPDEPGFWEASWYDRGRTSFETVNTAAGRIGVLVCTELWFLEHARAYAAAGVDLLVCPRATPAGSVEKWVAGGRVAGVCAGAFCLSSNRAGAAGEATFGGAGWVTDPEGAILARTSASRPFITVDVDLAAAQAAKRTYPRYVDARPVERRGSVEQP